MTKSNSSRMTDFYLQSLAQEIQSVTSPFYTYLSDLHQTFASLLEGKMAADLQELTQAQPQDFGICVVTLDGNIYEVGDCQQLFPIQSLSRALLYGLVLEDWGREVVNSKVGVEPAADLPKGMIFDEIDHRPPNPLVNAGAIAIVDLITANNPTERLKRILDTIGRFTGRELTLNLPCFLTQKAQGHGERAAAHLMMKFGSIDHKIDETLDLYFQQQAIQINNRDLATISATLANGGINPLTGVKALDERYVQDVLSVLFNCGMYERSGEWIYQVGMPAQCSTNGGILAIVPQKLGISVFSPLLNKHGISIRGMKVLAAVSRGEGLHLFNIYEKNQQMLKYIEQVNKITLAAAALENGQEVDARSIHEVTERSDELGHLARVFVQMLAQVKEREQKLTQQVQALRIEIDQTKKSQQVANIIETDSFHSLKQKLQRLKQAKQDQPPS